MRITSAATDRFGRMEKGLRQGALQQGTWWTGVLGWIVFAGFLATAASAQPLELVSPNEEKWGGFGYVAGIPDVNGDGRGDVVVGAPGESPVPSATSAGRAYIFSGADGILLSTLVSPNPQIEGLFGLVTSGVPDLDGDGRGDVVVGTRFEDTIPGATNTGRAYIFSGSDGALLSTLASPNEETQGAFSQSLSGIPDMNGDGRGDVIVGANGEDVAGATSAGRAYIFSGSDGTVLKTLVSPNVQIIGIFGYSVSGVPDVDGDGRGDVVVGAPRDSQGASPDGAGRAYVFSGSDGALLSTLMSPNEEYDGLFGAAVSGVPDADGDGRGDVIVGAFAESGYSGRAYLFSGSDGALLSSLAPVNLGQFGRWVSGIPDMDGDGRGDVVVGAHSNFTSGPGEAHIFSGTDGTLLATLVSPNPATSGYFYGLRLSGMPDANRDGLGDVAVGATTDDPGSSPDHAGRAYIFSSSSLSVEGWTRY